MGRGDSFARQHDLMRMLSAQPMLRVAEAAAELGTTTRTVYRDLAVLQRAGFPLYQDRSGRKAIWRVHEGYRHPLRVSLGWSELFALSVGARLVDPSRDGFLAE